MSQKQPPIHVEERSGATVISFPPDQRVLSRPAVEELGEDFLRAIDDSKNARFVVSFAGIEYMSSTVLGTLVSSLLKIQKRGGQLRVASVNDDLDLLFRLTGLHKIFQIHESVDAALLSFE